MNYAAFNRVRQNNAPSPTTIRRNRVTSAELQSEQRKSQPQPEAMKTTTELPPSALPKDPFIRSLFSLICTPVKRR